MSDRYKQLIFPDDVVRCRPESQPQSQTPVKVSASVSSDKFKIGDRVSGSNHNGENLIGKVSYVSNFGFAVTWDGRNSQTYYNLKDAHTRVKKVREQFLQPGEKVREQTKNLPSNFYIEIKPIKGNFYKYARWREDGVLRSKYLGKCSLTESRI